MCFKGARMIAPDADRGGVVKNLIYIIYQKEEKV